MHEGDKIHEINENQSDIDTPSIPVELSEKLAGLPTKPGVYQYKNSAGKIIYVGKAKNLRNRVRSYFQEGRPADAKTKALVAKIADIEIIVVDSEAEALILEDTLIKKHKPRYNVLLRDDKSYPYIRVTNEAYPRIFPTRTIIRDGSRYFGPYSELRPMKAVLRMLRNLFMFRSCDHNITADTIARNKYKICLDYHIKKCEGPCEGLITQERYNAHVKAAMQILSGKTRELEQILEQEMESLSEELRFEEAAMTRNRLAAIRDYNSKQKIVTSEIIDRDIFGLARLDDAACSLVFKIREGKLIGKRNFIISSASLQSDEEIIQRTLEKWYLESEFIPKEIYLPCEPDQLEYLLDWLGKKRGKSIDIHIPKIGDKRKFVQMANSNAEYILREYNNAVEKRDQTVPRPVTSLQRDLRLEKLPRRIECFDNSHIQGSELVSSLVVFEDGKPKKSDYRKFKIKTVGKNDDFAAMQEVVRRRYTRLLDEAGNESSTPLPDLIVVDGGKGQLSSAVEILHELGLIGKIPVIGLAKRLEEVFFPGNPEPVMLPRTSSSLRMLQHIRDEAHRFAITFHRQLREKRTIKTELTEIKGIGEKIAQKLLIHFGSVENIKAADKEKVKEVAGAKVAAIITEYFTISHS